MNPRLSILAIAILAAAVAHAAGRWQGPGWYQVVEFRRTDMAAWKLIVKDTPFANEAECLKTLHPDYTDPGIDEEDSDTFKDYSCERLDARPTWDRN
ncbi:MAG: hypothetical protein KBA31_16140 [Alphaproteobacteria bacterium]|nr:hypothetical protein [Alphaproteobacteria bacterium]